MFDLKDLMSRVNLPQDITRRGFLQVATVTAAFAAMNQSRAQTGAQPYIIPEFDSYFWAKARPALSLSPKNFYRQCSLNVALYDIIKSISVLEGDNASARFNRFG